MTGLRYHALLQATFDQEVLYKSISDVSKLPSDISYSIIIIVALQNELRSTII